MTSSTGRIARRLAAAGHSTFAIVCPSSERVRTELRDLAAHQGQLVFGGKEVAQVVPERSRSARPREQDQPKDCGNEELHGSSATWARRVPGRARSIRPSEQSYASMTLSLIERCRRTSRRRCAGSRAEDSRSSSSPCRALPAKAP